MTGNEGNFLIGRRTIVRLALAAALAPAMIGASARAQVAAGGLIAPPAGPMAYRRTVVRSLGDGQSFAVARGFVVRFRRFPGGFLVQGQQADVTVDAPAPLSHFAELERQRDESRMFPIMLDSFGHIRSPDTAPDDAASIDRAVERAFAALSQQQLAPDERTSLESAVTALHATGQQIIAHLPNDLFAPAGVPRLQEQSIALPGGGEGRVFTHFDAQLDTDTGLMREAERQIMTEVDSSRRTIHESWSLTPH